MTDAHYYVRDGQQTGRHLFAGSDNSVILPGIMKRRHLGAIEQAQRRESRGWTQFKQLETDRATRSITSPVTGLD